MKHNDSKRDNGRRGNVSTARRRHTTCGLLLRTLLLLMFTTGGNITWGQAPQDTDRSGYYYIANHHNGDYRSNNSSVNYYLVPSDVVYHDWNASTPNQQPYLTTYKTNKDDNSRWKVLFVKTEDDVDYYTIMHVSDKKYLTWNGTVNNNVDRVRVHLQKNYDENNALFFFTEGNKGTDDYNICSKGNKCSKGGIGSLNPAKNNYDDYGNVDHNSGAGTFTQGENTIYCDGLVGVYEQNDSRGVWYLEKYGGDVCKNPVIAYSGTTHMEITCPTSGATIYYKRHYVDNSQDDETWQSYDNNSKINVTNELVSVEAYAESPSDQSEVTNFNLTPETPTITYNTSTNEITISSTTPGATLYYTINGNEATTSSTNSGITPITLPLSSDIMTIRSIAKKGGVTSSESTKVCIKLGSGNPYLLQSVECTDFYMTVGDVSSSNTTVNTSSLPQAGISWYFEDAGTENGVQYYYVYNTSMGAYLQRNGTNLNLLTTNNNSDAFKFSVLPYYDGTTLAGYNLQSKANSYYVHKANGNGAANAVNLNANSDEARSRWNFILVANKNFTSLVSPSGNNNATYYTLTSTAANTYLIVPPTASTGYVTTATGTTDNQKWYFQQAYTDGWASYYYILNAVTGEAIHFRGTESTSNQSDALEMTVLPATPDANYQFALAPTTTSSECYIIPRPLAQFAKTNYAAVWREGTGTLQTRNSRADNKIKWKISLVENYVAPPYITYDITTNTATISCTYPGATIYYTTDGTEATTSSINAIAPVAPSPTASTSFVLTADVTTIRAIASKGGVGTSSESTYSVAFQLTLSDAAADQRPYLIQSQNYNTSYVTWTEPCYYMIPSDVSNDNITVNTTTLLQPSMEWYFLNAGVESDVQYYYIVNNSSKDNENHPYYLCYDSGVFMRVFDSENANKYKFSIVQYPTTGTPTGFNLKPYGQTSFIHKSNGNNSADAITLNSNNNSSGASIWKFIIKADLPASLPFSVSDNRNTYYYKLSTNANSDYFITPSTTNEYVTTYNTTSDNQNWYFEQAEAATDADWLTYYHIRNAITGEYLYYNGEVNGNNHSNAFELHSSIGNDADRYKFAMTRAIYQDRWFIVPKVLKNTQFANISTIWRDNNNALKTQKTRNNSGAMWQFTVSNFCMPPFFEESNGNITISCDTKGAEIHFLTDGNNPTEASTLYNNDTWDSSNQVRIKAIAVVMEDEAVTASSAVITLLNNPDITLEAGPYEYKGAAWEPSLTVSIGESGSETTAPTSPASYTTTYANNINAGTATVTLTDVEGDSWYIWNGSTTFTIDQKAITITADSDTKEYDGTPLTKNSYTYSPVLATGDSFESVTITGSQTDAGSNSNVPSAAVIKNGSNEDMTANYDITYANGTLKVTVRSIGNGSLASGFTLEFGEGGAIILKDGDKTLTKDTDYSIGNETTSESGKYTQRKVSGNVNYTGNFTIRNANVNFQNDGNGGTEYSATFVAENALGSASNNSANGHALPEGITAYIITSISGNNANAEALGYIPEGIPVLLLSNAASGGFVVQDASGHTGITSDQINNNMLEEVTAETSGYVSDSESEYYQKAYFDTRKIYLLYMNEFVYNMAGYLAKGKVYLNPNHSSGGGGGGGNSRLQIRWDTETGIDDSHLSPLPPHLSGPWYTLDGRRLSGKPTQKGLYLCNGQKTVVR